MLNVKETNQKLKIPFLKNHEKISAKSLINEKIIFNVELPVEINPIDPKRLSKEPIKGLTKSSMAKAGLVFLGTVGGYYLAKTTGIFSYFGWGEKSAKNLSNGEIMKVGNIKNALSAKASSKISKQSDNPSVNQIEKFYRDKDKTVRFKEEKVEEFKNFRKIEKENVKNRRSMSIQNPISDQNTTVGKFFELKINGIDFFNSNGALFLEAINIPSWLTFSNPEPTLKSSYNPHEAALKVAISGNYAYVIGSGLQIIDITDPANLTFKGSYDTYGSVNGIALSGNYAYVTAYDSDLQIIDVSNPAKPTFKGSYDMPGSTGGIALFENYACVTDKDGIQIIDISNPSNPRFKSSYAPLNWAQEVLISGNYAYVACYRSGLHILNISNPSNPTFKGSCCEVPYGIYDADISGNYVYMMISSLNVVDVSDPANPTFKCVHNTPGFGRGVTVFGNYAYVADYGYNYQSGLQIVDISDPLNPIFKGSYNTPGQAVDVALLVITHMWQINHHYKS
jgi:hypothetical protein